MLRDFASTLVGAAIALVLVVSCDPAGETHRTQDGISSSNTFSARVVGVSDGDTLRVRPVAGGDEVRVRIEGIDAPESRQPFGRRSKESLSSLVFGRVVSIERRKVDQYGRVVGKVFIDGTDVGLEQIRRGMAWHYAYYAREQAPSDRQTYAAAERAARQARTGLWADDTAEEPHAFRLQHPRSR